MKIGYFSRGISKIPLLKELIGEDLVRLHKYSSNPVDKVVGWGMRSTAYVARTYAKKKQISYVALEDGFLRSFNTGDLCPPLSLILDEQGIYYDATRPCALETVLASTYFSYANFAGIAEKSMACLHAHQLSKYNQAPEISLSALRKADVERVLVVDQTAGDMSVSLGAASAQTFDDMLQAALDENPRATIYVKTHPEVTSGRKGGYLTAVQPTERIVVLRDAANPMSLIDHMDKVYVVTSTMGFEALLAGKPVTCFGVPWYSGWGVTDDRQPNHPAMQRRAAGTGQQRSVQELFAAAYLEYTRYLNPHTHERGAISDVMEWLVRQREMAQRFSGRMIGIGFRRWKAANLKPLLSLFPGRVHFVKTAAHAQQQYQLNANDCLVIWGAHVPESVLSLARTTGARVVRVEDGFVRSVGLGSDLIAPRSIVLDEVGMYFDPSQPSALERLLNTREITEQDRVRAQWVRAFIVQHRLTKYNMEPLETVSWAQQAQPIVLVPGQVEDDASIRTGCDPQGVCTNLGLLQAARAQYPDAFIVYKPHPDVRSGNRRGHVAPSQALAYANCIEERASVVSCIEACDVVVTMTSLTGFDALLRGKQVVVHGRPFYAGWGLTQDKLPMVRRDRLLDLDSLVACTLLHYPIYWDPLLKGYTTCEAVLLQLQQQRDALQQAGKLDALRCGYWKRQWRKLQTLVLTARPQ